MTGDDGGGVDFFISHAGPDSDWAAWIGSQLVEAGYSVELDVWDWAAGTNFLRAMERAVGRARRMIAVLTPAYFQRTWTYVEGHAAFLEQAQVTEGYLVPVMVEACEDVIPKLFRPLIMIDLVGLAETQARRRLLDGLAGRRPAAGERVAFPGAVARGMGRAAFPAGLPAVRNLPDRNLFFTGRESLLAALAQRLAETAGPGRVAVCALQGRGGVGKSQLALEYAWRHTGAYQTVWWIDAVDHAGVDAGMIDLALELGLPVQDGEGSTRPTRLARLVELVQAELARRGLWLLIYDNVEDVGQLAALPADGHVLVTCRDAAVATRMPTLAVGVFPRSEAVQLLRRQVSHLSPGDADRVAATVGDLPLAVAQAGAYLAGTGTGTTDYLDQLTQLAPLAAVTQWAGRPAPPGGLAHADEPDEGPDSDRGLAATTAAALRDLADTEPAALDLLRQLAFLAPEPIPLTAAGPDAEIPATGGLVVGDPATTGELVHAIRRLDLARHSGTHLHVHRRVQSLVHDLIPSGRRAAVLTRALRLLATAVPGDPDTPASWLAYADLTPHLLAVTARLADLAVPESAAFRRVLLDTCRYLYMSGQYQQGRTLVRQTRERWQATLGDDHPDTLRAANRLANVLYGLGEYQAVRELHEDTLARRRRVLGDDHLDTLISASNVALALYRVGDYQAARELGEETLARRRRLLGDDHFSTLHSANNLADVLRSLGEGHAARQLAEDTLARCRRVLGDDHPHTLRSAHTLAVTLAGVGEDHAARQLTEDTLARRRRLLGDDHRDTVSTREFLRRIDQQGGEHSGG